MHRFSQILQLTYDTVIKRSDKIVSFEFRYKNWCNTGSQTDIVR